MNYGHWIEKPTSPGFWYIRDRIPEAIEPPYDLGLVYVLKDDAGLRVKLPDGCECLEKRDLTGSTFDGKEWMRIPFPEELEQIRETKRRAVLALLSASEMLDSPGFSAEQIAYRLVMGVRETEEILEELHLTGLAAQKRNHES